MIFMIWYNIFYDTRQVKIDGSKRARYIDGPVTGSEPVITGSEPVITGQ